MKTPDDRLPRLSAFDRPEPRLTHVPHPWQSDHPAQDVGDTGRFTADAGFFHDGDTASAGLHIGHGAVVLNCYGFWGSYASLALDLPKTMATDLSKDHALRVDLTLEAVDRRDLPKDAFLRLSVSDGGDPWHVTVPVALQSGTQSVPLSPGADLPVRRTKAPRHVWIDLVFTPTAECSVVISQLVITRSPMPVL